MEEYIKESLFLETSASKSLYRSLRLDTESLEIKRILDEQVVRSAAILKEAVSAASFKQLRSLTKPIFLQLLQQTVPTSQTQLEKRLMKKGTPPAGQLQTKPSALSTPKPRNPAVRPHSPDDEPDIDVENAPVIQGSFEGSFEITKTDADIARKKTSPTRSYHSTSSSSLPPKSIAVTPYSLRVKPKKPSVDKLTTITPQSPTSTTRQSTTRATTRKPTTTTTRRTTTTTTTTAPSTTSTTSTTTARSTTTPSTTTTTTTTPKPTTSSTTTTVTPPVTTTPGSFAYPASSTVVLPKLDANLFTTFPILDTQPWRPIHREVPELLPGPPPAFPTKTLPGLGGAPTPTPTPTVNHLPQRRIDELELPFIADNPTPPAAAMPAMGVTLDPFMSMSGFRKPDGKLDMPSQPQPQQEQDMLFYHNFGSPVFMPGTENIERLGGALVEPHPLPVPLIDDVIVPPFRPINPTVGGMNKLQFNIEGSSGKFEHLGGGVIAKKQENATNQEAKLETTTTKLGTMTVSGSTTPLKIQLDSSTRAPAVPGQKPTENSVLADTIGEFFMELLNLPKEENGTTTPEPEPERIESRIEPEEAEVELEAPNVAQPKPNFMNLKELILQRNAPSSTTTSSSSTSSTTSTTTTTTTTAPSSTKKNRIRPNSERPTMLDDSNLFPSHSKWEFVNSSAPVNFGYGGNMRKVFNKTLQAWVSEDVEKTENFTLHDIKTRINNASNIQDISLIFDTLASKLGITPSAPMKFPPFSQNKLKHGQRNETKVKPSTTTTTTSAPIMESSVKNFVELPLQQREPFIRPMSSFMEDGSTEVLGAAIPVVGEAEVEVVDPLKYEELLKTSQFAEATSTEPSPHRLVTLLPVRSNSGIRTYKPIPDDFEPESQRSQSQSEPVPDATKPRSNGSSSIRRKSGSSNQSRRFGQPPAEAIVKGGIKVTVEK